MTLRSFEVLETRDLLSGLSAGATSLSSAVQYLAAEMDRYQDRFVVYEDVSSPGSHFFAYGKIPDGNAPVDINGSWTVNPHSGATAIRAEFHPGAPGFGGFYFMNGVLSGTDKSPQVNFGTVPNAGVDLRGATDLVFWARGERGGEKIEFFLGGVGHGSPTAPFPDSSSRFPTQGTEFVLQTQWQEYRISVRGLNLSYVLGGFGWVASASSNPTGAVFYLDDISYELDNTRSAERLSEPRFIRSYATAPVQSDPVRGDFDLRFRNSAFTYDNDLAILAFLAEGSSDSVRRATLVGDAFVYAAEHDRAFTDGRIRSDYAAGDLTVPPGWTPNGRVGTVTSPGFYVENEQRFEDLWFGGDDIAAVDVGNNAWTITALIALYNRTGTPKYLATAKRIGDFIATQIDTGSPYQGFRGGIATAEGSPVNRAYAATEHNLDIVAAATALFNATGDPQWQAMANTARTFVLAMWDENRNAYLTGTTGDDQFTRNPSPLPLDVQAWSALALPDGLSLHPDVLDSAIQNHLATVDGLTGFDFNEDKDGVWLEGTGQMAVALAAAGKLSEAETVRVALRNAQTTPPFGNGQGIVAASHDGVSTGFEQFKYFRSLHIGATAWLAFAQSGFNPYYQFVVTWQNPRQPRDVDADGQIIPLDALKTINNLIAFGPHDLTAPTVASHGPTFFDVDGNGVVSPLDALIVINYLIRGEPSIAMTPILHDIGTPLVAATPSTSISPVPMSNNINPAPAATTGSQIATLSDSVSLSQPTVTILSDPTPALISVRKQTSRLSFHVRGCPPDVETFTKLPTTTSMTLATGKSSPIRRR